MNVWLALGSRSETLTVTFLDRLDANDPADEGSGRFQPCHHTAMHL
jgi:hypothetical protein